jgi:hypothetical protein
MLKLNIYSNAGDGEIRSRLKDVYEHYHNHTVTPAK